MTSSHFFRLENSSLNKESQSIINSQNPQWKELITELTYIMVPKASFYPNI